MDNTVTIKSKTDDTLTVEGWLVVFGGKDLTGERFNADTDFWLDKMPGKRVALYDHSMNAGVKAAVLGYIDIEQKDMGLWAQAELDRHNAYMAEIEPLIESGTLGWSSGSVGHLVTRSYNREADVVDIKSWPIVEGSLTPTPAEPRTLGVAQVRAIIDAGETLKGLLEGAGDAPVIEPKTIVAATAPVVSTITPINKSKGKPLDTILDLDAVNAAIDAKMSKMGEGIDKILKRFEDEPVLRGSGVITPDGGGADPKVKNFADFLVAVQRNDTKRLVSVYGTKAALAEGAGQTGGFLVPKEYASDIMSLAGEDSIVRPRAYIQPMHSDQLSIPSLDQTTVQSAGNSAFYGGVVATWTGEAAALTEKEPTFRLTELNARKLGGYTLASNEMMADSAVGLEALLKRLFAGAVAFHEDYAFLRGNGVGKPLGIQNANCAISVTRASSGNDFDPADVGSMLKKLLPSSHKRAIWIMHPFVLPSLIGLASAGSSSLAWVGDMRSGYPATLLGLPIVFSEKMVASGTAFDVLLADLSYYVIGDRSELAIGSSEHFRFTNDQTTWKFSERVDGQPWLNDVITLADATSTVSPFVYLT